MHDPSEQKKNNLAGIIRDFLRGKPSEEGEELFNNWWNRKPEPARTGELSEEEGSAMADRVFLRLKDSLPDSPSRIIQLDRYDIPFLQRRRKTWVAAAAVLLIIATSSYLWYRSKPSVNDRTRWLIVVTGTSERRKLTLNDGTIVTLNENSRLRYPKPAAGMKIRETEVEGEAFFEVAKDPEHPFIVSSLHAEVKVLGTRFDVITSRQDSSVIIAMKDGKVALRDDRKDTAEVIYLSNGDVGILGKEGQLTQEQGIAGNENYFSWIDSGSLSFDGVPLTQVITQLKRIYGRNIRLNNPSLKNRKITLFYPGTDLGTILKVIGKTMNAQIAHTDDTTYIIK